MKFVDEITISVSGGRGGNGCMSFLREKFRPKGGPDGGNGGRGGDVILKATTNLQTLADFEHRRRFASENGGHGEGAARNGKAGRALVLPVPCGTIVYDAEDGEGMADLVEDGDTFVAAMGGRGGRGNRVFASSLRRAPRFSEKGEMGESRGLRLELKLIADIGLIGLPNAGKSSILAAVSNAAPKIADYPFTTLSPNLGVLFTDEDSVVLADIPGLIEGASRDKGLGLSFLRHIERTRMLLHVLDLSAGGADAIMADWKTVRAEMEQYDKELGRRPCVVVGNKSDECPDIAGKSAELAARFSAMGMEFTFVSALTGENIGGLVSRVIEFSRAHPRPKGEARMFADARVLGIDDLPQGRAKRQIQVVALPDGSFRVLHPKLENAAERYDLSQDENVARFTKLLRKHRVEELLMAAGATAGASVSIGRVDFDFHPDDYGE
ncbi:MAG: GTPase ObgE [Synergistaceae bacterium]|jgi:GTP-binding protein|nr:GTPase ObgE [Synergistaceae bacterium]